MNYIYNIKYIIENIEKCALNCIKLVEFKI